MSYDKNTWQDSDYITTSDMNRIENGLNYVANKAGSSYVKTIWKNGDIVSADKLNNIEDGLEKVTKLIDSDFNLQTKTITYTPTENQITDTITKDVDYDFLGEVDVNVNAIPNNYVGSSIPRRNSNNITVIKNPLSVSIPGGYYESSISKELDLEPSLIRFIDYDGTILHEYSKDEFLSLSSMPSNPTHSGLVSQGWNWSLSDAQAYVQEWGYLNIGQMYITLSGDTEIDVEFPEDSVRLSPYLGIAVNGTVEIDWGDNSTHSTVTGTSLTSQINTQHTYSQPGNYTIKIHVNSGSFAFYNTGNSPLLNANNPSDAIYSIIYSSKVKNIRIGENCVINNYAFNYCYYLSSITIPTSDKITSIGSYAFNYCYSLQLVTIPNSVTSIDSYAFSYCFSLQSVTIPSSVTYIYNNAFNYCYSLESITIPNSTTSIGTSIFSNCYSLNIKIIPKTNLKYIVNSQNLLDVDYCINNCYDIKNTTISEGATSIKSYAFQYCYSLQSVTIPNTVTSIGSSAFDSCYSLQSITIPSSVTSINGSAFYNCYSLQSVTIPSSVTSIGGYIFQYCYSLKSITIPNIITSIGSSAFYNCYSLKSITIPNTVTSIGGSAFRECRSLQSVTIPEGISSINTYTFYYCFSLQSITIPSSVTSIGTYAFYKCVSMKEYHLKPTTPPTLSNINAFNSIPSDCIIYVPQGTLSDYKSANNWSTYADYMQEEIN